MTRLEALRKLIAVEPIEKDEMYHACGWPMLEVEDTLKKLLASGEVIRCGGGWNQRARYRSRDCGRTNA